MCSNNNLVVFTPLLPPHSSDGQSVTIMTASQAQINVMSTRT